MKNCSLKDSPNRADIFSFDESSIAELFYTSGSTGNSQGRRCCRIARFTCTPWRWRIYIASRNPVDLHTIPLFHANGWGRPQASTMLGTKQIMVRRFDPATVFRLIEEHRATDMALVPTMANALLNCPDLARSSMFPACATSVWAAPLLRPS